MKNYNYFEESRNYIIRCNFCYPLSFFFFFIVWKRGKIKMIDFAGYIWKISFYLRKLTTWINFIKINLVERERGGRETNTNFQIFPPDRRKIRKYDDPGSEVSSFGKVLGANVLFMNASKEGRCRKERTQPQCNLYYWKTVLSNRNLWKYCRVFLWTSTPPS